MKKFNGYQVGQKVRLVDNRDIMGDGIVCGWNSEMELYLGKVVTIDKIDTVSSGLGYVKVKENGWSWDIRFLEPYIEEKPINIYHDIGEFDREDEILPMNYALVKVIENANTVICFVMEFGSNKKLKIVTVCQDEDTFDLHKGVEICMYKALIRIADSKLKRY